MNLTFLKALLKNLGIKGIAYMNQTDRKKIIMEQLAEHGSARLEDLAAACGSSEMTIRRDLAKMEVTGYLVVNRGLISLTSGMDSEISSSIKAGRHLAQKKRIAKAAAEFIEDGSTIYLDCGTTVRELAMEITGLKKLTVYSNSLLVCNTLCSFPNISLFILPGRFDVNSMGATDTSTLMYLQQIRFDAAFFGAEAIHPDYGFMVPDANDCNCKRMVLAHVSKSFVLSDSSKLYFRSRCIYAQPNEVNTLITDDKCPAETRETFRQQGVQVIAV